MKRGYCESYPTYTTPVVCAGCGKEIDGVRVSPFPDDNCYHNEACWLRYIENKYGGDHGSLQRKRTECS